MNCGEKGKRVIDRETMTRLLDVNTILKIARLAVCSYAYVPYIIYVYWCINSLVKYFVARFRRDGYARKNDGHMCVR